MRFLQKLAGRLVWTLTMLGLAAALWPSSASAQMPEGTIGWSSTHTSEKFVSAEAACISQWHHYNDPPKSRYVGAFVSPGNLNKAFCKWTQYQNICPEETGGGISSCGTVYPTYVELKCQTGYTPTLGKYCQKDPVPERPCNCNNGGAVNPQVGNPIVLSTGAKVLHSTDYATEDGDFTISRSYRSTPFGRTTSLQTLPLGLTGGWQLDFMYELQLTAFSGSPSTPSAKLALLSPDGTAYDFVMQSGGAFVPDTTTGAFYAPTNLKVEFVGTLPTDLSALQSASTQWRLTDGDDTVWTFQTFTRPNTTAPYAVGRPISRVTREGYQWNLSYRADNSLETVTDSFGRQATFNWSIYKMSSMASPPAGWLPYPEAVSSVILPDGTTLRYTYDPPPASGVRDSRHVQRLARAERIDGSSTVLEATAYSYEDPRFPEHITRVADRDSNEVAKYAYDERGRGISTERAIGSEKYSVALSENTSERVSTVSNALGKTEQYHFQRFGTGLDFRLTSVVSEASPHTPSSTQSITYGINNFIATQTDAEGRVTSYTRDARGRPTTIVEAYGTPQARTTTITWHSTLNVPSQEVTPGLQVDYTYYPGGQLQTRTETDTTSQSVPYSTAGQTRTWTYTWGTGGRLASINGPKPVDANGKDDITTFVYDSSGNLQTSTNGLGQVTTFASYDASGRPGTMTDPNGVVTAFTYDALGRTKTSTVKHPSSSALDAVTSFDYDAKGLVTGITSPATDKLIVDYDAAGRVAAVRAASGERIDYQYDADGNVTSEAVKRTNATIARQVKRTFDELGRLISEVAATPFASQWSYDKVGNLTQAKAPKGSTTTQSFDALNRLVTRVAPDSGTTMRGYDAADNLVSHTDPISVTTQFVRNGFGDVIRETSPDRGTSTYYYNEAGELTAAIDGRGQRIDYSRDILGRVTQKVPVGRPTSETITYTYDTPGISGSYGVGRLSSVADGTGSTSFAYDHRGNLVTKRQAIGTGTADLAYSYDLGDRVTQVAYPSGRIVQYAYDSKGRVSQVQTKASAGTSSWTILASSMSYEPFGSVKTMALGNGLAVANDWGNDGRLASRRLYRTSTNADLSNLSYGYDANDNLNAIRDLVDDTRSAYYGYDANDRLTLTSRMLDAAVGTDTYTYTSGTNRLASVVSAAGTRSIVYDTRGNTISETSLLPLVTASYDGYARLLTYERSGDPAQSNAYNGLDDRVTVNSGGAVRHFVYDADGRVLGEYGADASDVIAETIWMQPEVAIGNQTVTGDDGVGGYAPLAIGTGSGSSAALTWMHGNHLGVPVVFADASGTAIAPPSYSLPGFPGQMKTLSDIYYNRYRDYDVNTGRYVQADPIGLEGGSNPYLYAKANPLRWTDRLGLAPGDKWYGYNNREFQRWFHRCWKQPGDPDATKEEIAEAYGEWVSRGSPTGGRCWNERRSKQPCPQNKHPTEKPNTDGLKKAATWAAVGTVLYWVISEGSRLFPPRNLIPVP